MGNIAEKIRGLDLTGVQRDLLLETGTVQDKLSSIFNTEVHVEVLSQRELYGVIIRWVRLQGKYQGKNTTFCLAESVIPIGKNENGFLNGIRAKDWGIGKLINAIGFLTKREIFGAFADENMFARNYIIKNVDGEADLEVVITEMFPKRLYED
jgi:chorismate-pyruvate lyase